MTPRKALRVRQSTTAAAVSRTPAKDDDGHSSFGRRSLPRTAKVVAQLDGYQDQFNSPDKNHGKRKTQTAATPATKISQQMATVLTFESPENCRLGLRTERRSATVHRRLDLSSAKVTHDRGGSNHVEVERDENIPPMGDTVGRRLPKRTVKVIVRLRSVVPHVDGTIEYRTVGSESPWGVKRSPAKVVFTTTLKPGLFSSRKCDLTFERGQLESSASEYSSDESDESGIASSEDGMEQESLYERRTSVSRNKITFKTITTVSPEKRRGNATHNPRAAVKKVQTLEDFRRRLHTAAVPERMPCREEEAAEVERFIRNAISVCGSSSAMYISGVPGTGKTATVMSVVKQLCRDKSCNKFCFVTVNAMEFIEPKKIFVEIYNQ
ncbi:hypothetical protein NECAME_02888 [Necator americanus]|uniref:Origin recognition complex subunit 1 n=1 Tax=Necator americanus TaxID=51031 RepID=W2TB73_NECAM|nr:hypothetical protein NECAME_02888 [Necator americanus]ETN78451.1 hypothetical protein NECAME_02888 [Necator americanus]